LKRVKTLWKTAAKDWKYQVSEIFPEASQHSSDSRVIRAKELITEAIKLAPKSNAAPLRAVAKKALAYEELRLLHRVVNEFKQAESNYLDSLALLESVGGLESKNDHVLNAYRETSFRLGELYHAHSKHKEVKGIL
jgi:hypothetical protein